MPVISTLSSEMKELLMTKTCWDFYETFCQKIKIHQNQIYLRKVSQLEFYISNIEIYHDSILEKEYIFMVLWFKGDFVL